MALPLGKEIIILRSPQGTPENVQLWSGNTPAPDRQVAVVLRAPLSPNENILLGPFTSGIAVYVALTGQAGVTGQGIFAFGDISIALTGLSCTGSIGALTPNIEVIPVGQVGTSSSGLLAPNLAVVLTGQSATAAGGIIVALDGATLTGLSSTASGGLLVANLAVVLTGLAANTVQGTLTPVVGGADVTQPLTGPSTAVSGGFIVFNDKIVALTGLRTVVTPGYVTPPQATEHRFDVFFTVVVSDLYAAPKVTDLYVVTLPENILVLTRTDEKIVRTYELDLAA